MNLFKRKVCRGLVVSGLLFCMATAPVSAADLGSQAVRNSNIANDYLESEPTVNEAESGESLSGKAARSVEDESTVNIIPQTMSTYNPYTNYAGYMYMNSGSKTFELNSQSGQGSYDTMQGGCTDGTYAYFVLYNRNVERCKIAKVRMSDWKIIKVSNVLYIEHGNDLTYNSDTNEIVAVHLTGYQRHKRISVIDPDTLTIKYYKDIEIPETGVDNLTSEVRSQIRTIYGIAYNSEKKQYVVGIHGLNDFLILDQEFKAVTYWKSTKTLGYLRQSLDTDGKYVFLAESFASGYPYNIIAIYTWDGQYVGKIYIKKGQELETVFHTNGKYYAGFYESKYVYNKGWKLVRLGNVYRIQFKYSAKIQYSPGSGNGTMSNSTLYYGVKRTIKGNTFTKKGYRFLGWRAYRSKDNSYRGYNHAGRLGWYPQSEIKVYKLYKDKDTIQTIASSGTIKFTARWRKK